LLRASHRANELTGRTSGFRKFRRIPVWRLHSIHTNSDERTPPQGRTFRSGTQPKSQTGRHARGGNRCSGSVPPTSREAQLGSGPHRIDMSHERRECSLRSPTCELRSHRQRGARPVGQMIAIAPARAWRQAVGALLERGVMPRFRRCTLRTHGSHRHCPRCCTE